VLLTWKLVIESPRTTQSVVFMRSPLAGPALLPSIRTIGFRDEAGLCLAVNHDWPGDSRQRWTSENYLRAAGGNVKSISFAAEVALASRMAWRKDPAPLSAMFWTRKVLALTDRIARHQMQIEPASSVPMGALMGKTYHR